jgi:hypothetical protein
MSASDELALARRGGPTQAERARDLLALTPALAAIAYPFILRGFHAVVSGAGATGPARVGLAAVLLLAAFLAPGLSLVLALRSTRLARPSRFQLRARRLALFSVAAPPLFVFIAFLLSILRHPLPETWAWAIVWSAAALWTWAGRDGEAAAAQTPSPPAKLRVAHGAVAALVLVYVLFHLANHLMGLVGPDAHAAVMKLGRKAYRARAVEPLLVGFLLFQVASGGWLAWRWSAGRLEPHRMFQVASGVYLWFFILTHMNSALVSARLIQGTDTNWAWASGAPDGLIRDAWNIRLLPHYALGVFFVLSHLASGLRGVALAHGLAPAVANRIWAVGVAGSALVSAIIVAGLCGARL